MSHSNDPKSDQAKTNDDQPIPAVGLFGRHCVAPVKLGETAARRSDVVRLKRPEAPPQSRAPDPSLDSRRSERLSRPERITTLTFTYRDTATRRQAG